MADVLDSTVSIKTHLENVEDNKIEVKTELVDPLSIDGIQENIKMEELGEVSETRGKIKEVEI